MIPKFNYFRSKKHLKNVASLCCQHCGADGCTQAAHSNWAFHGKGRGIKASDQYTAALCHFCHYELDQGKNLSRLERQALWFNAWHKTVAKLQQQGKWPKGVECDISQHA
jgi:hypothetical protein